MMFQFHVILSNVYDVTNMHDNDVITCIYIMILIIVNTPFCPSK